MIYPNDKQDLVRIADQRNQIGRMIRTSDAVHAVEEAQPKSTPEPTAEAPAQVEPEPEATQPIPQSKVAEPTPTSPHTEENPADPTQQDPPLWVQEASLSELLLWRLGIPVDREAIQRQHQREADAISLKPPITTRKVAEAIAHLSRQLIEGKIDANTAKTSLYALQTLLTALRLQIVEEKKARATRTQPKKRQIGRRKPLAKRKR